MNTERLHKILTEIQKEFNQNNLLIQLQAVRDNLTNQVNQPQQPVYQQNLVAALSELNVNLTNSSYNNFSPGWKQIIEELGGHNLFGDELKSSIDDIFNRNQITPAAALDNINSIVTQVELLKAAIDEILSGFTKLKIGKEDLAAGQCEMGYSIPRKVVENKLSSLSKEVAELNFILGSLSETITGKKEEFEVKTISSSDFLLYVIISLQVADVLSNAIEKIINNYKTILEIKILRNQLKEKGVPEKATKEIEEHANSSMEEVIRKIANEVITQYHKGQDQGRKNELENATVIALNKIANRIDKGFNIEVRVEPLPPATEKNKDDKHYQAQLKNISNIQKHSKTLQYINTVGQPILELNEAEKPKPKK
jgi:hypothetical protein